MWHENYLCDTVYAMTSTSRCLIQWTWRIRWIMCSLICGWELETGNAVVLDLAMHPNHKSEQRGIYEVHVRESRIKPCVRCQLVFSCVTGPSEISWTSWTRKKLRLSAPCHHIFGNTGYRPTLHIPTFALRNNALPADARTKNQKQNKSKQNCGVWSPALCVLIAVVSLKAILNSCVQVRCGVWNLPTLKCSKVYYWRQVETQKVLPSLELTQ